MPLILPTPDELAALPWHTRDRAVRSARALIRGYGATVVDDDLPADGPALRADAKRRADAAWGARVRAEARRLAGEG